MSIFSWTMALTFVAETQIEESSKGCSDRVYAVVFRQGWSQTGFTNLYLHIHKTQYFDAIHSAHIEYGELMYPKKEGLCNHCGVLYTYD